MGLSTRLWLLAVILLALSSTAWLSDASQAWKSTAASMMRVGLVLLAVAIAYPDLQRSRWRVGILLPLLAVGLAIPKARVPALAAAIVVLAWPGDRPRTRKPTRDIVSI